MKRLLLAVLMLVGGLTAQAQQTVFVPVCAGTNDTAKFTAIIATIGANTGTIRIPYKSNTNARCAVNTLTVPTNIALDNTDGVGIKVNTGQTLTVNGPRINPPSKTMFYNVGVGQGAVVTTASETYVGSDTFPLAATPAPAAGDVLTWNEVDLAWEAAAPTVTAPGNVPAPVDIANGTIPFTQAAYEAWPSIVQFASGSIGLVYNHGTDDGSTDNVIHFRKSTGFGAPWSAASVVASEGGGIGSNLGAGGMLDNNRLIVCYGRATGIGSGGLTMPCKYTDDEGDSWSDGGAIPKGAETGYFLPYGAPVKIDDGKYALSWFGQTGGTNTAYITTTTDNGLTWSAPATIAAGINECSTAYLGERKIVAICRRADSSISHQFLSNDNAATWADQGQINFPQADNGAAFTQVAAKPVFLTTFNDQNGRRMVAAYFFNPGAPVQLYVSYGRSSEVDAGPGSWLLTKWIYAPPNDGMGSEGHYPHVFHSNRGAFAFGAHNYYHSGGTAYSDVMLFQVDHAFVSNLRQYGLVDVAGGSQTAATSLPFLNFTGTWNQSGGGTAATFFKMNVTDTFSGTNSLLMDLQKGGVSQFNVRKDGLVTALKLYINNAGAGLILKRPDGTCKELGIDNTNTIVFFSVTCP